jgi:hypothetical protein
MEKTLHGGTLHVRHGMYVARPNHWPRPHRRWFLPFLPVVLSVHTWDSVI